MSETKVKTETPRIYGAICDVMSELGAISKDKKNTQQNYAYRGVDDVMNALQPLLMKHRIFTVPEVLEERREDRQSAKGGNLIYTVLKIKYTFYADDGSCVETVVMGEGMDSGDKSGNKAMSIGYKYACFQIFCIATEETADKADKKDQDNRNVPVMIDPDAESHEVLPKLISENGIQYIKDVLASYKETAKEIKEKAYTEACKSCGVEKINKLRESDKEIFIDCVKKYIEQQLNAAAQKSA